MAYKCRLFSSDEPGDMEMFEELMTRASETDSVSIVQKETKLTEQGKYLIALHWIEESSDSDSQRKALSLMLDEGL